MVDNTELQSDNIVNGKYPPERTAGLKPYKPGESGNPAGRPPNKRYLSELARDLLEQVRKGDLDGKTTDELVVLALVTQALRGNTKAIEMLHDWTEGKVPDKHEIETGDISIVYRQVEGKDATK